MLNLQFNIDKLRTIFQMESFQSIVWRLPVLLLIIYAIDLVSGLDACGSSFCWVGYHCCGSSGYCCPDGWVCSGSVCINIIVIIIPCVIAVVVIVTIVIIIIVCKKKKAQGRVIQQPGYGNQATVVTSNQMYSTQQPMQGYGQPTQPPMYPGPAQQPMYPGPAQQPYGSNPAYPPPPDVKQPEPIA